MNTGAKAAWFLISVLFGQIELLPSLSNGNEVVGYWTSPSWLDTEKKYLLLPDGVLIIATPLKSRNQFEFSKFNLSLEQLTKIEKLYKENKFFDLPPRIANPDITDGASDFLIRSRPSGCHQVEAYLSKNKTFYSIFDELQKLSHGFENRTDAKLAIDQAKVILNKYMIDQNIKASQANCIKKWMKVVRF